MKYYLFRNYFTEKNFVVGVTSDCDYPTKKAFEYAKTICRIPILKGEIAEADVDEYPVYMETE